MAKQSKNERNAGLEAARMPLTLEALEQRILLSNPGIGLLADSPDPVNEGSVLTLTASQVFELGTGSITGVKFYRSTDNIANPTGDTLLGAGTLITPSSYRWTGAASWAASNWYYYAVATDSDAATGTSPVVSGKVNALPVITSLTGSPQPTGPSDSLTLTAGGVSDSDGSVSWVDFYHDANNNGVFDGADTFLGRDYDGGDGWSVSNVLVQWTTGDYFARARDNDGAYSVPTLGHVDQRPIIASVQNNPNPAVFNQFVTFTASGVTDSDGTVASVAFYRDADGNGAFDASNDQLLGPGINQGGGTWTLSVYDNWDQSVTPLYFAVATDNEGFQSRPAAVLNQNPTIDSIQPNESVATLGAPLDLQAIGVQDADGSIANVVFSVGTTPNYWPYRDTLPTDEYSDTTLGNGWTWNNLSVDWTITDIAQADFNNDGYTDLAVAVDVTPHAGDPLGTAGGGPDFIAVLTNNGNGVFTATSVVDLFIPGTGTSPNYNPQKLAIGDFNEDGMPDIAVANHSEVWNPRFPGEVSILLNDGTGSFPTFTDVAVNYPGDLYTLQLDNLAMGDYNGDGHLDLVAYGSVDGDLYGNPANAPYEMPVLLGDGTGAFTLNRIYSYGSSLWVDASSQFRLGGQAPGTTVGVQDMLSTDLDQHEDGGADIAMVGQGGLLTLFDYLRGVDTTAALPDDASIFTPGNVIGRAFQTGLAAGVAGNAAFYYTYRTGNTYDYVNGDPSTTDDYYFLSLSDNNPVDMYQVGLNAGETLNAAMTQILLPDDDPVGVYAYIYDANGTLVYNTSNAGGGTPTQVMNIDYTAAATGNYYVTIAGSELTSTDDYVDPFTGYWHTGDNLPGGTDVQYALNLVTDGVGADQSPEGAGDSVTAADFMEDNYYNNGSNTPTPLLKDTDLAISNSLADEVTVLFGTRVNGYHNRLIYDNFVDNVGGIYDIGHSPTSITAYNVDSDTNSELLGDPNYNWHQGSVGVHADEIYNDLVTTNSDGSTTVLINTGDHDPFYYPDGFGTYPPVGSVAWAVSFDYTGQFDQSTLGYTVANNAGGGPLQDPVAVAVGDFNNDGLPDFAVAEQHDIAVLNQADPFHSSDPLDLNLYSDELPDTDLTFGFSGRYSVVPSMGQRPVTYYAVAFDNLYGYPYNLQYEGYSTPTTLVLPLNQRPQIWNVTANAEQLVTGDAFTLTANGVQDLDGYVAQVRFYQDNGDGIFDGTDTLLGTDKNESDGWSYSGTLDTPQDVSATYYAIAYDNDGATGAPRATQLNVDPTVAAIYADGVYNAANDVQAIVGTPGEDAVGVRPTNVLFNDANNNGRWDPGENLWVDGSQLGVADGKYNEETRIYLGTNGVWNTAPTTAGKVEATPTVIFKDVNGTGVFSPNDPVWVDADHNGMYDSGEEVLHSGSAGALLQVDDPGIAGNVHWVDIGGNGWDNGDEVWADAVGDPNDNPGIYDGIQETQLFQDAEPWTTADGTLGIVGNLITTGANGVYQSGDSIWADEIQQGQSIVLTATGVQGGENATTNQIKKVEFFLDANYDGVFEPGVDTFLGRGLQVGGSTWELALYLTYPDPGGEFSYYDLPTVTWAPGTRTYFAVAQDGNDDWSAVVAGSDYVRNLPPLISGLTANPDPVTQGQDLTLTANGVEDHFGQVNSVAFYLDDGDGVLDTTTDTLLGIDQNSAGGWNLTLTVPTAWSGQQRFYAVVTDNSGDTNEGTVTTTVMVDQPPIIDGPIRLTPSPEPVLQGHTLTLTTGNIHDPDAGDSIANVEFYRDSNGNGVLDPGVDQLLNPVDVSGPGGDGTGVWTWSGPATFPVGGQLYFARALDSAGGYSDPASVSGRVQNPPPTIDSLVASPDPVTQGYNLTLTAQNVADINGTISKVEFYRDSDHNGSLNPAVDTLLGTVNTSLTQNYVLISPVTWAAGSQLYFARAQDNQGAWSTAAVAQGLVNARPAIGQLTADPSPLVPGESLTLTAGNVTDSDGTIASVAFYRDTNGDGVFQPNQDGWIGTDTNGADGWSLTFTESTAVRRFFAVATDDVGGTSQPAQVDVLRAPTIGSITGVPNPVTAQQQLVLTASNVNDIDGTAESVQFYRDDGNGIFDSSVDTLLGTDITEGDGWSISVSPTWGAGMARFFARAVDNEGAATPDAYAPTTTVNVDESPTVGALTLNPADVVNRGSNLTLTATGVSDDVSVSQVNFYRDADGNGLLDPALDQFLGSDSSAAGGWALTVSTAGWPLGDQTYFAQAVDNLGALSDPASATNRVNGLPVVGTLQVSPNPVVRGDYLSLVATNVNDLDGTIAAVRFYRDSNGNGVWDSGDLLLGTDGDGSDGWSVSASTAGWTVGSYAFFARAVDNDGGVGTPAKTTGAVTTAPALVIALNPASDTGASQTDAITMDNTPSFDFVVNDTGTIYIDWDNNGTVDQTIVANVPVAFGDTHTYNATSPTFSEGAHTVAASFDDTVNVTDATKLVTIDTTAPGTPDAPDLQALSDNGLSNTDNVTSILTPTFDITNGDAYLRFFRDGVQISNDFEPDSTYTTPTQPLGTYNFTVEAVDAAGNFSGMSGPLAVTFTGRPATPAALDLQPGSDSGVSQTDNITKAPTLVFDAVPGIAQPYLLRLWRGNQMVNEVSNATTISDASAAADGTYQYAITVVDLTAEQESLRSAPLAVTIDRTAPTLTDPNISVVLSTDNGIQGLAEYGDTVTVTWDNSALGDSNTDVSSVAVDLTQYGFAGQAAMYDNGTHGDATAGDGIWTLDYTITSTNIAMQSLNVDVYATDIAGNVGVGHDTSGIRVRPKLIAQTAWQGFDVSVYDVDGNSDFNPEDIVIKLGKNNSVKSIVIGGTGPAEGLGISISGATSVGSIKDARKGPLGDIAFIASDAPIKSIQLKSGVEGYNLNGQIFGNLHFAADVDGDGSTTDATGIYGEGPIGKLQIGGNVMADVWIGGVDPKKGMAFGSFQTGGDFHGDFSIWGNGGKVSIGGDFGSSIYIDGSLASLQIGQDLTQGAHVFVRDLLSKLRVGGSLLGNAPEDEMVQLLAGSIGKGSVGGTVRNSRILAGADLGADWAVGGAGDDADSFSVGQIGGLKLGGNVVDSLIGAGLVSHNGAFDLAWLATNNAFLNGSAISKLTIGGALTSSAPGPQQPFGVGAYQVGKYKINGSSFSPLVFSEV